MIFRTCLLLFLTSFISPLIAQSDTTRAYQMYQEADQLHGEGDYGKSADLFAQSASLYAEAGWLRGQIESLLREADNRIRHSQFDEADALNQQSEELMAGLAAPIPELQARLDMNRGLLGIYSGKQDEAEQAYLAALDLLEGMDGMEYLLSTCYNDLGVIAGMQGDFQDELSWYEKALEVQIRTRGENDAEVASTYNNIGTAYYRLGDYASLDKYLRKAEAVLIRTLGGDHPYMATVYNNLAYSSTLNENFGETIRYHEKALRIHLQTREESHALVAITYNNLGDTYGQMGDLSKQLFYLNKALNLRLQVLGRNHNDVAVSYQNLGHAYGELGDHDRELEAFEEALSIRRVLFPDRHPEIAKTLTSLAEYYQREEDWKRCFELIQQSFEANSRTYQAGNFLDLPALDEAISTPFLLEQLTVQANTLMANGSAENLPERWNQALEVWLLADSLVWLRRGGMVDPQGPSYLGNESKYIYAGGIACASHILEESFDESAADALLLFLARGRAATLWEAWQSAPLAEEFGVSEAFREKESELKEAIGKAEQSTRMAAEEFGTESREYALAEDSVFQAREAWKDFIRRLNKEYPGYADQMYSRPQITWTGFREQLGNRVVIAYFMGDDGLYRFGFQQDQLHVSHSPRNPELNEPFVAVLNALKEGGSLPDGEYERMAQALTAHILTPVLWELSPGSENEVVFMPHGVLGYLPMEALAGSDDEFSYLTEEFPIRYQNALMPPASREQEVRMVFAGFAPQYDGSELAVSRSGFAPLSFNENEVDNALEVVGDGGVWNGPDATEERFKEVAPVAKILHLAMHGRLNDQSPAESYLAFSATEDDDGKLYAYEIAAMNLQADLAVLSACETGTGAIQQGEGIMSIARAFQEAGCKSVLMSLWAVNDEATYEFMARFYQFWGEGHRSAKALQMTRESMRSETRFRHPHYWAGFVLMGDSMQMPVNRARWPWIVGGFFLALVSFIFYSRRRSRRSAA